MANTIYPTDVSALILIDLLNDFLSPKGKAYSRLAGQFEKVNFIPNVTRLLAGARAAGLQIVYAPHGLNQHSFDDVKYIPAGMVSAISPPGRRHCGQPPSILRRIHGDQP